MLGVGSQKLSYFQILRMEKAIEVHILSEKCYSKLGMLLGIYFVHVEEIQVHALNNE